MPAVARSPVGVAVDLVAASAVERLPAGQRCTYLGVELPLIAVAPFEASAPAKLRAVARALAVGHAVDSIRA